MEEWKPLNPPPPVEPDTAADDGPHPWREHFRGVPVRTPQGPGPMTLMPELADDFAGHIERVGFVHVDDLAAMAVGGVIRVEDLPAPTRTQLPPEHGQDTWLNPPRWVDDNEQEQS